MPKYQRIGLYIFLIVANTPFVIADPGAWCNSLAIGVALGFTIAGLL